MREAVDTLLIIRNDKLRELFGNQTIRSAFANADQILCTAAKGIAEVITLTGEINVDMNDVNTVMRDSGRAIMGSGSASGQGRAQKAVSDALESPLLNDSDITGANFVLLNITFGTEEILMDEIMEITDHIQEAAGQTAEVIWGYGTDPNLGEDLCVTVIATGFDAASLDNPSKAALVPRRCGSTTNLRREMRLPSHVATVKRSRTFPQGRRQRGHRNIDREQMGRRCAPERTLPHPEENTRPTFRLQKVQAELPQDTLNHREFERIERPEPRQETRGEDVSTNEEFIIYNLDDVPEPEDLTSGRGQPTTQASRDSLNPPRPRSTSRKNHNQTPQSSHPFCAALS